MGIKSNAPVTAESDLAILISCNNSPEPSNSMNMLSHIESPIPLSNRGVKSPFEISSALDK